MIYIESRRKSLKNLKSQYPDALIIDVTSKAEDEFVQLSPFYPHGGIPVPGNTCYTSYSVEGVWQGLKTFEGEGIDINTFRNNTMKGLKRTVRTHGKCLGHKLGTQLLGYIEARHKIYVPTYNWMLENKCLALVKKLRAASKVKDIVLLDYETNCNVDDRSKPLSHASLVKAYIEAMG